MSCEGCHHNRDGVCGVDGEPIENIAQDEECWTYSPEPAPEPLPPADGEKKKYRTVEEFLDAAIEEAKKVGGKKGKKVEKQCLKAKEYMRKPVIGRAVIALYERELKKSGLM